MTVIWMLSARACCVIERLAVRVFDGISFSVSSYANNKEKITTKEKTKKTKQRKNGTEIQKKKIGFETKTETDRVFFIHLRIALVCICKIFVIKNI